MLCVVASLLDLDLCCCVAVSCACSSSMHSVCSEIWFGNKEAWWDENRWDGPGNRAGWGGCLREHAAITAHVRVNVQPSVKGVSSVVRDCAGWVADLQITCRILLEIYRVLSQNVFASMW